MRCRIWNDRCGGLSNELSGCTITPPLPRNISFRLLQTPLAGPGVGGWGGYMYSARPQNGNPGTPIARIALQLTLVWSTGAVLRKEANSQGACNSRVWTDRHFEFKGGLNR